MLRVLHSVSNMDRAGIETMLMNYYRHIDRDKIQFDFLCNKTKPGAYDEEIKKMGGHIYHSPGLNPLKFFKYKKFMMDLFRDNPDIKIMHSHNGEFAYQSLYGAWKSGIKTRICHAHNTKMEQNLKKPLKMLYKTQLKKVSNQYWGCGRDAVRFYFGNNIIKENKYMVLHNAIDVEKFSYDEDVRNKIRNEFHLNGKFVIGHVGRFMEQKNHEFILDMFRVLLKKEPDAVLLLLGDGELKDKMIQKVKKLKISASVIFVGNVNNVNEIYQAMDAFILPSLFEGLPVVGIEAQAAGLKCYFSDMITNEVKITDNVKYLSLTNNSLEEWSNYILADRYYKRENMDKIIADAGYSIKQEARRLEEIYMKLSERL